MRKRVALLLWILIVGLPGMACFATAKAGDIDLYSALPENERSGFRAALELVIALQKAGRWEEMYQWLDNEKEKVTLKQFLSQRAKLKVLEFVPERIFYFPPDGTWEIVGCARLQSNHPLLRNAKEGVEAGITARRTISGWRFSAPPAIVIRSGKEKVKPCSAGDAGQPIK